MKVIFLGADVGYKAMVEELGGHVVTEHAEASDKVLPEALKASIGRLSLMKIH